MLQGDQPGPLRGVQAFQAGGNQNAVLAGQRDDVGDGAERDQIEQRAQIEFRRAGQTGFASAFDQGVGELEGEAGGAEFVEVLRLEPASEVQLRIHERHGFRCGRGNLMVVEHDDIHAALAQPGNGFNRSRAAVPSVDCGSTAVPTIAWLKERGVDVIVLDHHQVSSPAPAAVALVNPQLDFRLRTQDARLQRTLLRRPGLQTRARTGEARTRNGLPGAAEFDLRPLLDLVALGTIADIVPLIGENRILVSTGLERLNATQRPGLVALKQVAQAPPKLWHV